MSNEFLDDLANELNTQSVYGTANPLYCVQQKHRIFGVSSDYTDNFIYVWRDDSECIFETHEEAMKEILNRYPDTNEYFFDNWIVTIGYIDINETVCVHLTERAAERYIEENSYRLNEPRMYINSQYRCHEFNQLIDYVKSLK